MRIAIIGAGFSGCQLTLELLRRARPGTQILLFDGAATFGRGLAFRQGTIGSCSMSASPT